MRSPPQTGRKSLRGRGWHETDLDEGCCKAGCSEGRYFSSSTDDFAEGVYITVGAGAGFRKNLWRFANAQIKTSG
jgi:hypothetical protein